MPGNKSFVVPSRCPNARIANDGQASCLRLNEGDRAPRLQECRSLVDDISVGIGLKQQIHAPSTGKPHIEIGRAGAIPHLSWPAGPDCFQGLSHDSRFDASPGEGSCEAAVLGHPHEGADGPGRGSGQAGNGDQGRALAASVSLGKEPKDLKCCCGASGICCTRFEYIGGNCVQDTPRATQGARLDGCDNSRLGPGKLAQAMAED